MRIKLKLNLGRDWPYPWKEDEVVDNPDPEIAKRLLDRGLAEQLSDVAEPARQEMKQAEVKPVDVKQVEAKPGDKPKDFDKNVPTPAPKK